MKTKTLNNNRVRIEFEDTPEHCTFRVPAGATIVDIVRAARKQARKLGTVFNWQHQGVQMAALPQDQLADLVRRFYERQQKQAGKERAQAMAESPNPPIDINMQAALPDMLDICEQFMRLHEQQVTAAFAELPPTDRTISCGQLLTCIRTNMPVAEAAKLQLCPAYGNAYRAAYKFLILHKKRPIPL